METFIKIFVLKIGFAKTKNSLEKTILYNCVISIMGCMLTINYILNYKLKYAKYDAQNIYEE